MTVAYWLEGFLGRATLSRDNLLRAGGWQEELLTEEEAEESLVSLGKRE